MNFPVHSMQTAKQVVLELLNSLPDDCTLDDIVGRLSLLCRAHLAMTAIEQGEVYSREEVAAMIKSWANQTVAARSSMK